MIKRALLLSLGIVLLAEAGLAAPVIDRLDFSLKKQSRLTITVEATLAAPGEIRVTGNVGGVPVSFAKRVRRASRKRARFRINPRRLKLRNLDRPLVFDLGVTARETDGATETRDVRLDVPVPLVVLGGFGNEDLPANAETFATAVNLATGNAFETDGKDRNLAVHTYPSRTENLATISRDLDRQVRKLLKRSPFSKVDVVGYSMGGIVARDWMVSGGGSGKVRRLIFLATPNEGTPLAYLAVQATQFGLLDTLLPEGTADLLDQFLDPDSAESLRAFFPTYDWAVATLPIVGEVPVPAGLLPDAASPLTALNAAGPEEGVLYDALAYRDAGVVGLGLPFGTVETVDFTGLVGGEGVEIADLASGEGDGVIPIRSVFMEDEPAWRDALTTHDMGSGTHVTMLVDPSVILKVAELLTE